MKLTEFLKKAGSGIYLTDTQVCEAGTSRKGNRKLAVRITWYKLADCGELESVEDDDFILAVDANENVLNSRRES